MSLTKVKTSLTDRIVETVAALILVASIVITAMAYSGLPEVIPTHYNLSGEVDGWGSKCTLIIFAVINIIMYVTMTFLQTKPAIYSFPVAITDENRDSLYALGVKCIRWVKLIVLATFTYLNYSTIEVANGRIGGLSGWYMTISVLFLITVIIYYIRKMYALK